MSVEDIKKLRVQVDALIQAFDNTPEESDTVNPATASFELYGTAGYQVRINLIQAKMWLGKMLEGLGNPFPSELADKASLNGPAK